MQGDQLEENGNSAGGEGLKETGAKTDHQILLSVLFLVFLALKHVNL